MSGTIYQSIQFHVSDLIHRMNTKGQSKRYGRQWPWNTSGTPDEWSLLPNRNQIHYQYSADMNQHLKCVNKIIQLININIPHNGLSFLLAALFWVIMQQQLVVIIHKSAVLVYVVSEAWNHAQHVSFEFAIVHHTNACLLLNQCHGNALDLHLGGTGCQNWLTA